MDKWMREQYKSKGLFGNSLDSRRSSILTHRKEKRNNILEKFRNIPENMSPVTPMIPKVKTTQLATSDESKPEPEKKNSSRRMEMLKKWKEERNKRKMEEKKKTKAPFKVCHVDHRDNLEIVYKAIKGKPVNPIIEATAVKHKIPNKKETESKNNNTKPRNVTDNVVVPRTRSETKAWSLKTQQKSAQETKKAPVKLQKEKLASDLSKNSKNHSVAVEYRKNAKNSKLTVNNPKNAIIKSTSEKNEVIASKSQPVKRNKRDSSTVAPEEEIEVIKPKETTKRISMRRRSTRLAQQRSENKENEEAGHPSDDTQGKVSSRRNSARKAKDERIESDDSSFREVPKSPQQNFVTPLRAKSRRKSALVAAAEVDDGKGGEIGADRDNLKENGDCLTPVASGEAKEAEICYVSPFVTMSRGKGAARKEYEKRKSGNGLDQSLPLLDPRSPKAAADYFTLVLRREIDRIVDMCKSWQEYRDENKLTEDASGLIDMTIGQSNLLITKKFEQFRGLIERCRSQQTVDDMRIQCEDLHGFWDMIYKQVTDLDRRFANLEDMRRNDWLEMEPKAKEPRRKAAGGGRKKIAAKKTKASSSLREKIAAARKNNARINQEGDIEILISKKEHTPKRLSRNSKGLSTPARGILKAASVKSEKIKSVAFQIPKENDDVNEMLSLSSGGLRRTPLQKRRSSRISLNRGKLFFEGPNS